MPVTSDPPCHPEACKIQNCLLSNNYQQDKCEDAIANLYKCCAQFYVKNGDDARTDGCPMPSVLRRKLKDMNIQEPTR
ncbi:hypothetical protein JCM8115_004477 [Rhodotorula mucilaginosa]